MTRGGHVLAPRPTRRSGAPGAHAAVPAAGHSPHTRRLVRRSSAALAAALTTVALTTTAAVSLTGNLGATNDAAASEPAAQRGAAELRGASVTDPETRSAAEKAAAVLGDADYVTREGDLSRKERKRLQAAAEELRTMVDAAGGPSGTAPPVGTRQTAAASRTSDRASLAERAVAGSADETATTAKATADVDRTEPTNLAPSAAPTPISEQGVADLPILATPLADSVAVAADTQKAKDTDDAAEKDAAESSADTAAPSAERIEKETTSLQRLITKTDGDAVVSVKAGPTPEEIAAAKQAAEDRKEARADRAAERKAAKAEAKAAARAAEAKEMAKAAQSYGNGEIPSDVLCELSWASGEQLRCDAAAGLEDLNDAFRATFGRNLDLTDGYRSFPEQVSVAASKGGLAAVPGTSNHGLGQAVDLSGGIQSFGSAEHSWMVANAGKYGWKHPAWAQAGGTKPEAWHWEYGTSY